METLTETQESKAARRPREKALELLDALYGELGKSEIGLRREHLERLIPDVEDAANPPPEQLARWGIEKVMTAYGNGTLRVYEAFSTEPILQGHAITHEVAEAVLDSGLFQDTDWEKVVGNLEKNNIEDSVYVRTLRKELRELENLDHLSEKAKVAGMEPENYLQWMKKRVLHERLAEALAFYLRSGGDVNKMFDLRMEHVSVDSIPEEWQLAIKNGDQEKLRELTSAEDETGTSLRGRHEYLFNTFHEVLGKQTPKELTESLNEIEMEGEEDELYERLLELEMDEMIQGIPESAMMARAPKIRGEKSFLTSLKEVVLKI